MQKKKRVVVVVLEMSGSAGRKHLTGILKHVNSGHDWNIRIYTESAQFSSAQAIAAEAEGVDGYLVYASSSAAAALSTSSTPTVLLDYPTPTLAKRKRNIVMVVDDDITIGVNGAKYLRSLGSFSSFGFVPDAANRAFSRLRERGFREELRRRGITSLTFDATRTTLCEWISSLPKPAAVMAAYDYVACEVIKACETEKIAIPSEVTILGVDNDELICDSTKPSISSIKIDHERIGFLSAQILDRMMNGRGKKINRKQLIAPANIVERASTNPLPISAHLAKKAMNIIETSAINGITPIDICSLLGTSRRLVELRFRQTYNTSLRKAIENQKLNELAKRLRSDTMPINKIAALCGFCNPRRLTYVFKNRFGMSMRDYRNLRQ